ncbi:hypothetical protein ASPTUDRAFT_41369 [Aspergillus tubingensis CBS 134.48]|uniref:Secreted protein n=1 Tax=Aspergillus tubingensis (strain CBS 134.48) TaxID=767770 RepID=A0A1L9N7Q0_ASPTC|nr:hypothetical protein ASPTUDRAFT_41369 [Aspergillus tubingensis CBS 134.48]
MSTTLRCQLLISYLFVLGTKFLVPSSQSHALFHWTCWGPKTLGFTPLVLVRLKGSQVILPTKALTLARSLSFS